jgi:hypothetical protein
LQEGIDSEVLRNITVAVQDQDIISACRHLNLVTGSMIVSAFRNSGQSRAGIAALDLVQDKFIGLMNQCRETLQDLEYDVE